MAPADLPNCPPVVDRATSDDIANAAAALRASQLVVFPTETFYAIGADPMQSQALAALAAVKGREPDKPVALIAATQDAAFAIAREIPAGALLFAETFWPGPLTLVLPARPGLNRLLIGPDGGVGVRVSPHPIARELATAAGGLLTATSANLSGQPPARILTEARQALGGRISVYIDGGALSSNAPSTVVEFTEEGTYKIMRLGAIDQDSLSAALRKLG